VQVGQPGCGKAGALLAEMAGTKGRYLFALQTTELVEEKLADLRREAAERGTEPVIRAVHSRVPRRASVGVAREIADAVEELSCLPHVVLVVIHEGLIATDFSAAAAAAPWHARVDEVPSETVAGEFRVPSSARFLEAAYGLAGGRDGVAPGCRPGTTPRASPTSWRTTSSAASPPSTSGQSRRRGSPWT
jgi:hypothetical protein